MNVFEPMIVITQPGLEQLLAAELNEYGWSYQGLGPGYVWGHATAVQLALLQRVSRIAEAFGLLIHHERLTRSQEIPQPHFKLSPQLVEQFLLGKTFAVRCSRWGQHTFTSVDVERALGAQVNQQVKVMTGVPLKADLRQPERQIEARVIQDDFIIYLNVTGISLNKRWQRSYPFHDAPLYPNIAAALLRRARFPECARLLEPMCGSGTIVREALLWAKPPGWERRNEIFLWDGYLSGSDQTTLRQQLDILSPPLKQLHIMAMDVTSDHVAGAQQNCHNFLDGAASITWNTDDVMQLTHFPVAQEPWLAVCNPPFGVRIGRQLDLREFYAESLQSLARKQVASIVAVTPRHQMWRDGLERAGYRLTSEHWLLYGELPCFMISAELN